MNNGAVKTVDLAAGNAQQRPLLDTRDIMRKTCLAHGMGSCLVTNV